MEMNNVTIPYDDFVSFVSAKSKLDAITAMISSGNAYCSDSVKCVLGIHDYKNED